VQEGVLLYGVGVYVANQIKFKVCNLSGTTQSAISNLLRRVLTIG
jgi:hypothetical protein